MRGASRAAFGRARDRLAALAADPETAAALGDELFAVTGLLDAEPGLRRALADPASPAGARTGLARGLLGGRVSRATLDLLAGLVADRWSAPGDLADAAEQLAVLATAAAAGSAAALGDLEDDLFRFGQITEAEPELYAALASPVLPAGRKRALLEALLAGKVSGQCLRLVTQAVTCPRGRSLEATFAEYARLVAAWRDRLIAVVRVAVELTGSERERLTAALAASYGQGIQVNVIVDPQVGGGMSVQIGDELIDGTIASRLAALRRRLAA
jgi:F-type H+-transporting ATPase subunit delta